jgi:hypothetical protein
MSGQRPMPRFFRNSLFCVGLAMTQAAQVATAQLVSRPPLVVSLFNVDDVGKASLNGQQVATAGYNAQAAVDITSRALAGSNNLGIQFINNGGGWTYGYRLTAGPRTVFQDQCGVVGRTGCDGPKLGVVLSRSLPFTYYGLPKPIPVLRQVGDTCWAYTATIMLSYRDNRVYLPQEVVRKAGAAYENLLNRHLLLPFPQAMAFFSALGLKVEAPQSYSVAAWTQMLQTHGPLWVTTFVSPPATSVHARVLTAVAGDGSPAKTYLWLIDPAVGQQYIETLADFTVKFEAIAKQDLGPGGNLKPQVLHF